jgi:hypothetical protein
MPASDTFAKIKQLAAECKVLVSAHGYDELAADGIFFSEILSGLPGSELVEDYPGAVKGPTVLILLRDVQIFRCMPFGGFPRAQRSRPCWSRRIVLIRRDGRRISRNG